MQELIYLFEKFLVFISAPFIDLVNISITASWVVLAVVVIRFCLKKAPKWLSCALWGVVALRLVFPFSLESELSLIPSTQTINPSAIYNDSFEVDTGFSSVDSTANSTVDNAVNGTVENTVGNTVNNTVNNTVDSLNEGTDVSTTEDVGIAGIIAFVWLIGMFAMAGYAFISFLRLKLKLRTAVKKEGNIYQSESVSSPFVLGLFSPKIYLSYKTDEADIPLVIEHEKAHIKRFDHIIKPLGYLLLSVHWFNPLMWVAYILLCRDIEAACDEKVIKELGEDVRKSYSTALLNASISRRSVAACPLAFGEVGVKERIKGVMNYKKPAFWVIIAGVAVCIIAAVCLLTNPKENEKTDDTNLANSQSDQLTTENTNEKETGNPIDSLVTQSDVTEKITEEHTTVKSEVTSEPDNTEVINGVTADISHDAQPQLTGKVTSATDKVINMELTYDQGGIKKGTPVTVRLGSMLSYAPEIDISKLKKGDIVTVIYDGRVMETYPLQIDAYAVYKKDNTVFDTENIARITFYAYYGHGKGSDVPAENMAEITNWLSTFTVDKNKKLEGIVPPGTNTHYVEIEYLDGTVVKQGLDTVSVDGVTYYLKHADAPDCFSEIISKTSIE